MNIRLFLDDASSAKHPSQPALPFAAVDPTISLRTTVEPSLDRDVQEALWRRQALMNAQQGRISEAIALLTDVIGQSPTSADYNNRGLLHFQNGQPQNALADYDQALQLNPRQAKVYNNRANCYVALGNLPDALVDYETALDLDPANIHAWINQGITFRDLEMYPEAIENFDLALKFDQMFQADNVTSHTPLLEGHIYAERGRAHHLAGDWNCAVADYHRAFAVIPDTKSTPAVSRRLRQQAQRWLDSLLEPLWN